MAPSASRTDSVPARALAFLRDNGPVRHIVLCRAVGVVRTELHGRLKAARRRGIITLEGGLWRAGP